MGTYKVLQDIEAEDKFVGPLTLKQFILACITAVAIYLAGFVYVKYHVWIVGVILLPIIFFGGFLAFPWGRDQPTEVWLLAKIRFMLKPRNRYWDQTGMKELVTITAPKKMTEQFVGKDLNQYEVKSRLKALADTIDSRGWAIKNSNVNLYADPGYGATYQSSDRLVDASTLTHDVPSVDINASDDILDESSNPTAQHLGQMISTASQNHRQSTMEQMQAARDHQPSTADNKDDQKQPPADYWFMNQPPDAKLPKGYSTFESKTILPGSDAGQTGSEPLTAEELALLDKHHHEPVTTDANGNPKIINPHSRQRSKSAAKNKPKNPKPTMTQTPDPAILNLANDDDKSVATIARMANRKPGQEPHHGEVIVPLR